MQELISSPDYESSYFTDERDGQSYKIIKINNKWWMAENLNYKVEEGSWAYENEEENTQKWGRLYAWEAAIKACPDGWHIATDQEWQEIERFVGVSPDELNEIGWRKNGDGKYFRIHEFINVVDGGFRPYGDGEFDDGGDDAYFWTSTSYDEIDAWKRYFCLNNFGRGYDSKRKGFSVRCVKN